MNGFKKVKNCSRNKQKPYIKHYKKARTSNIKENGCCTNAKIRIGAKYQATYKQIGEATPCYNNIHPSQFYAKPLWNSRMLPEAQVKEYLNFIKQVWPLSSKYKEEVALYILNVLDYNVDKVKECALNKYAFIELIKQCMDMF